MSYQEGLGDEFNVVPIAAGVGLSMKQAAAITFVCTGADTFTVTTANTLGGSYSSPGNIITRKHTNAQTNGTGAWTDTTQSASNAVTIAGGTVVFTVGQAQMPDPAAYVKVSAGAGGLVKAILHDLKVRRAPANLPIVSA